MALVKAEVPEEVQKALNMEAARTDKRVSDVAGQLLIEWYDHSEYDIDE